MDVLLWLKVRPVPYTKAVRFLTYRVCSQDKQPPARLSLKVSNETEIDLCLPSNLMVLRQVGATDKWLYYFDTRMASWLSPQKDMVSIANPAVVLALKACEVDRLNGWEHYLEEIYPSRN